MTPDFMFNQFANNQIRFSCKRKCGKIIRANKKKENQIKKMQIIRNEHIGDHRMRVNWWLMFMQCNAGDPQSVFSTNIHHHYWVSNSSPHLAHTGFESPLLASAWKPPTPLDPICLVININYHWSRSDRLHPARFGWVWFFTLLWQL